LLSQSSCQHVTSRLISWLLLRLPQHLLRIEDIVHCVLTICFHSKCLITSRSLIILTGYEPGKHHQLNLPVAKSSLSLCTARHPCSVTMATKTTFNYKWGEITIFNGDNYSEFSNSYMLAFIAARAWRIVTRDETKLELGDDPIDAQVRQH
jgi:hypothetical protein